MGGGESFYTSFERHINYKKHKSTIILNLKVLFMAKNYNLIVINLLKFKFMKNFNYRSFAAIISNSILKREVFKL